MSAMNEDEKIAQKYLESCEYLDIIYEPDGNVAPDFLVNNKIAIEVRRLNKHYRGNDKAEPLEEVQFKLIPKLEKLLEEFKGNQHNSSAFVSIRYSRPICKTDMIRDVRIIRDVLKKCPSKITASVEHKISDSIVLKISPSSKKFESQESQYKLGTMTDMDVGGYVVSEVYESLKIVLEEKANKISPHRKNYEEWWLVLVDHIAYGLTEDDLKQLKEPPSPEHDFDKVILISARNPEYAVEI